MARPQKLVVAGDLVDLINKDLLHAESERRKRIVPVEQAIGYHNGLIQAKYYVGELLNQYEQYPELLHGPVGPWTLSRDKMPLDADDDDVFMVAFYAGTNADGSDSYEYLPMKPCVESDVAYWMPAFDDGPMRSTLSTWWMPFVAPPGYPRITK